LADEDFNDDTKDAGELGAGHTVTALYEVVPTEAFGARPSVDPLRFQSSTPTATSDSEELMYVKLRYKEPDGEQSRLVEVPVFSWDEVDVASSDLRFASAVAAWGMILRDSEYTKDFRLSEVLALAGSALGEDAGGYRAEFLRLVERTRVLELTATRRD
jgi:Ca-activated chloride channel family protein